MGGVFSKTQVPSLKTNTIHPAAQPPLKEVTAKAETQPDSVKPNLSQLIPSPSPDTGLRQPIEDSYLALSLDSKEPVIPFYTLSVSDQRVCFFVPFCMKVIEKPRHLLPLTLDQSEIYHISAITHNWLGKVTTLDDLTRRMYTNRNEFVCEDAEDYRQLIVSSLLLGSRVRDYEQRCATVAQMGELVLRMPGQGKRLDRLQLKTISGDLFTVKVKFVQKEEGDNTWFVTCHESDDLPSDVREGCLLEIVKGGSTQPWQSPPTGALFDLYSKKKGSTAKPIGNWPLLSCIYGEPRYHVFPQVPICDPSQSEAVARYNSSSVPAFVIEAPPGSGKTFTAAAMAVSYKGRGVQLFLSTANVPVLNMALALDQLDYGSRSPLHLLSSEFEDKLTEENSSPFSALTLAKTQESLRVKIEELEGYLEYAVNEEERKELRKDIRRVCGPVLDEEHDIYFATVDSILKRFFKPNKGGSHYVDTIKKLLTEKVERVVIDEASQLTESALNALVLCFPQAQIVLIGDPKQLSPFNYDEDKIVCQMAARSALDVVKEKKNVPVVKLRKVYRASPDLIDHYSKVFYDGKLESCKNESRENPLSCFGTRSGGSRCLFWRVKNGHCRQDGTSKYNDAEITALNYIVMTLRFAGISEKDVLVISYYEAQRKRAEEKLKRLSSGYECLTVDSAQGREKKIVIVLTTRTSVPTDKGSFFTDPKRCNVAVSRHQEALIVLGHPSIAAAPNWTQILSSKHVRHVDDDRAR